MNLQNTELKTEMALKEWAIVCAALARGQQTILVRKGGIDEGPGGFQPEHPAFWLFPTNFHQAADSLNSEGQNFLSQTETKQLLVPPPPGQIALSCAARIEQVVRIEHEADLPAVETLQILSAETLASRFHYREPGLWVMVVRVYSNTEAVTIPDSPHLAGCRSWVDLPQPFSSSLSNPVLTDTEFQHRQNELNSLLSTGIG